jgi:hypothetical protein
MSAMAVTAKKLDVKIGDLVLTDTLVGDDGAIEDGDVGSERPNDQRGAGGVGTACDEGGGVGGTWWCVARL